MSFYIFEFIIYYIHYSKIKMDKGSYLRMNDYLLAVKGNWEVIILIMALEKNLENHNE